VGVKEKKKRFGGGGGGEHGQTERLLFALKQVRKIQSKKRKEREGGKRGR